MVPASIFGLRRRFLGALEYRVSSQKGLLGTGQDRASLVAGNSSYRDPHRGSVHSSLATLDSECSKKGESGWVESISYGPVRGTISARMQGAADERLPVPITCTLTVVGLLHPAEIVLLPLRPAAATTIVAAGVVPVPWYDRVTVRWLPSRMLKPVTVRLVMVLAALKDVKVPLWPVSQLSGPPLKPSQCPL